MDIGWIPAIIGGIALVFTTYYGIGVIRQERAEERNANGRHRKPAHAR